MQLYQTFISLEEEEVVTLAKIVVKILPIDDYNGGPSARKRFFKNVKNSPLSQ
jgi:hypothetical protein